MKRKFVMMIISLVLLSALGFGFMQTTAEEDTYDLEWETVEITEDIDEDLIEVQMNVSGFDGLEDDLYIEAWLDEDSIDRGLDSDYLVEDKNATDEGWLNHTFEIEDEDLEEHSIYNLGIEIGDGDGEIDYYSTDFRYGDHYLPPVGEALGTAWDWLTEYWYFAIILVASVIVIADYVKSDKGWLRG